ncbi:MAG: FAD-binding oxidoreductase [Acidimicrobiia bacterium]
MTRGRSFWGWGDTDAALDASEQRHLAERIGELFEIPTPAIGPEPRLDDIALRDPRVAPPDTLAALTTTDRFERALHAYGRSFRDVVRGRAGDFSHPPDLVALPRNADDVARLLDWCSDARVAAIPFGGGSSVVGGVEPLVDDRYRGAVSLDMRLLDRVLDIDHESRAARIQAGVYGPALEDQLRPHGLTLRHYPQSFEFSTLGGWIATRSGGHYATLHTHIDDFVESITTVTPRGLLESRRLPGSGAGPSPDRLMLGSEGALGVITEAWMRLSERPVFRARASFRFPDFTTGAAAAQGIAQSGLHPSNCRLLDPVEAMVAGAGDGSSAVLLVGFESADHPVDVLLTRAEELCSDHGSTRADSTDRGERDESSDAWRRTFLRAPYLRDALVGMGMLNETFETSVTWDRFDDLHHDVTTTVRAALDEVGASRGVVTCRFTHVYPDGPAPYFTVIAPGRPGAQLEQWATVKAAASEALLRNGATITHHHAVGRDHMPWYEEQRPPLFGEVLRSAKEALDPDGVLNPGVLVR